jgi:hypothetical protein
VYLVCRRINTRDPQWTGLFQARRAHRRELGTFKHRDALL